MLKMKIEAYCEDCDNHTTVFYYPDIKVVEGLREDWEKYASDVWAMIWPPLDGTLELANVFYCPVHKYKSGL